MTETHIANGCFGAVVTSSGGKRLIALAQGINVENTSAEAVSGALDGLATNTARVPNASKYSSGWITSINSQNVSTVATTLRITYLNPTCVRDTGSLPQNGSTQIQVFGESCLPDGWQGGVTITANNPNAKIACIVGNSNPEATIPGDWTNQYNADNQ